MIIWFSQDSSFTPPVCVGSYVAASIAGANPWKTGLQSFKIAKSYVVIGVMMVFRPILFTGTWSEGFVSIGILFIAVIALTIAVSGYMLCKANMFERLLLLISVIFLIFPTTTADIIGLTCLVIPVVTQIVRFNKMKKVS